MRTASTRDLRNIYNDLLRWVEAGEEVVIQRRGRPVARLVPENPAMKGRCDWGDSAAIRRDKSRWPVLSVRQAAAAVHDASGKW